MDFEGMKTASVCPENEPVGRFTDVSQVQKLNTMYIYAIGSAFYLLLSAGVVVSD